jgi:hypothetical protein
MRYFASYSVNTNSTAPMKARLSCAIPIREWGSLLPMWESA